MAEGDLFNERDRDLIKRVFSSPLEIPQEWLSWLIAYIESHPPVLPIGQIHGYQQPQVLTEGIGFDIPISAVHPTWSSALVGLSDLRPGRYLLFINACMHSDSAANYIMFGAKVNGVDPLGFTSVGGVLRILTNSTSDVWCCGVWEADLDEDLNTVEAVASMTAGTGVVHEGYISLLKIG